MTISLVMMARGILHFTMYISDTDCEILFLSANEDKAVDRFTV